MFRKADHKSLIPQSPAPQNRNEPAPQFRIELLEPRAMLSGDPVADLPPPDSESGAAEYLCNADSNVPAAQPVATQSFFVRGPEENA